MFEILTKLIENITSIRLTETQKVVLCNIHTAVTPKLAYEYTTGNEYKTEARKFLLANGFIQYVKDGQLTITNNGFEILLNSGIIDEAGNLTDYGNELISNEENNLVINN